MRILVISGDPKAIEEGSGVSKRLEAQARLVDRLDVFVRGREDEETIIGEHCRVRSFPGSRIDAAFRMVREASLREKYDIVTSQDPFFLGLIAWRISRLTGARLQLQLHTDLFSSAFWSHSIKNKISYMIARFLVPRADCVRVVSSKLKAHMKRWTRNIPITILPVFIDAVAIHKEPRAELGKLYPQFSKVLIVVARLEWEKQVSKAIKAMEKIKAEVPGAGLLIAGDGSKRRMLQDLAIRKGFQNDIIFLGWRSDAISLYKGADLMLQTSSYEGYGAAVVEALLCGCPVVSTDVGIAKEAGAHTTDIDGFADEAVRILKSGERGQLQFKLPSMQEYAEELVGSYESCVGNLKDGLHVIKRNTI